jgi:hypothetical protein
MGSIAGAKLEMKCVPRIKQVGSSAFSQRTAILTEKLYMNTKKVSYNKKGYSESRTSKMFGESKVFLLQLSNSKQNTRELVCKCQRFIVNTCTTESVAKFCSYTRFGNNGSERERGANPGLTILKRIPSISTAQNDENRPKSI